MTLPEQTLVDFEQQRYHDELGAEAYYYDDGDDDPGLDPDNPGHSYLAEWESPIASGRFHVRALDIAEARVTADKLIVSTQGQRITNVTLVA